MPKFSVLIIEDEKNIQTFMGKVLKRHDYRVLSADTGAQGLDPLPVPGHRAAGSRTAGYERG